MTIERILICVLFLLMVRAEINYVKLSRKHNGLTVAIGLMTSILEQHINGLTDELDETLRKNDRVYREYAERRDKHDD